MSKRTPKAKILKLLDWDGKTYRLVYLHNVKFSLKAGGTANVTVYAPLGGDVLATANDLYGNKGAFGNAVSFELAA